MTGNLLELLGYEKIGTGAILKQRWMTYYFLHDEAMALTNRWRYRRRIQKSL